MNNRRQSNRIKSSLPIDLQIDQQITITGQLKDISERSAFIVMKSSVYMQVNDEFKFQINNMDQVVTGTARISRIAPGEGIVVFFTHMDQSKSSSLSELLKVK